ncbi:FxsA family protein [Thiohalophilus sp.]|uniref:FxsA family protein n=1 Tax=Thiohalophilus sp. TaxID=3028392 RepID=UPI00397506AF
MFRLFLLLFIAIPLIEIYFLIQIGEVIGAWPTILLVVLTAVIGVGLLRWQGFSTLMRFQSELARGQVPAMPLLEGLVLVVAGALLLTPGFVTDAGGFILLVPPLRQGLIRWAIQRGVIRTGPPGRGPKEPGSGPRTIEGELQHRDDD